MGVESGLGKGILVVCLECVSHERGVESFKEAGLRGDKICAVSREIGVERS
jgi:hypothetical protein